MNIIEGHSVAIVTKYHGPTNTRGSRVVAKRADHKPGDPTYTHHWNYSLDTYENHLAAGRALIEQLGWTDSDWAVGSTETGYVLVRLPREVKP